MTENEQIIAMLVNGIAYITGSTHLAERVRKKIIEWKTQLWFLSITIWSTILYFWLW